MAKKRRNIEGGLGIKRAQQSAPEPAREVIPAAEPQREEPRKPKGVAPKRLQARVALSPGTKAALIRVARFENTAISQAATAFFLVGFLMYLAGETAPRSALQTRSHSRQLRFRYTYYPPGLWEPALKQVGEASDVNSRALRDQAREALAAPAPAAPWETPRLQWMTFDVPQEVRDVMAALARVHDTSAGYLGGVFIATGILKYVAQDRVAHFPFENKDYARSLGRFMWNISVPTPWLSLAKRLVADLRLPGHDVLWERYKRETKRLLTASGGDSWTFLA